MACSSANQSSRVIAIAFTTHLNLQLNLCSGVQGSLHPQHLPGSLGLIEICFGGGWDIGCVVYGCLAEVKVGLGLVLDWLVVMSDFFTNMSF
jgi:hypothetical protein